MGNYFSQYLHAASNFLVQGFTFFADFLQMLFDDPHHPFANFFIALNCSSADDRVHLSDAEFHFSCKLRKLTGPQLRLIIRQELHR